MRAALCDAYGGPEVLRLAELEPPAPGPHEVLVRVHASPLVSADARIRAFDMPPGFRLIGRLMFGFSRPRQPVLGTALAGTLAAVGREVRHWRVGDAVLAFPGGAMGCHAEYRLMRADGPLVAKPATLSFEQAAALPFGGATALHFLRDAARLAPGERLLVIGAAGTVGSAAVRIGTLLGASVTACAGLDALPMLQRLGAGEVVAPGTPLAAGAFDVVMDTTGTLTTAAGLAALAPGGRLVLIAAGLVQMLGALAPRKDGRRVLAGPAREDRALLETLVGWAQAGQFVPEVARVFALEEIAEAHAALARHPRRGTLVIRMGAP